MCQSYFWFAADVTTAMVDKNKRVSVGLVLGTQNSPCLSQHEVFVPRD